MLCRIISYHITPYHNTTYHRTMSYRITSHHTTSCHIILCHVISYYVKSYHTIPHHTTSHHTTSYHTTSYHFIAHHVIPVSMQKRTLLGRRTYIGRYRLSEHQIRGWIAVSAEELQGEGSHERIVLFTHAGITHVRRARSRRSEGRAFTIRYCIALCHSIVYYIIITSCYNNMIWHKYYSVT